jgi:hypothetical protein
MFMSNVGGFKCDNTNKPSLGILWSIFGYGSCLNLGQGWNFGGWLQGVSNV